MLATEYAVRAHRKKVQAKCLQGLFALNSLLSAVGAMSKSLYSESFLPGLRVSIFMEHGTKMSIIACVCVKAYGNNAYCVQFFLSCLVGRDLEQEIKALIGFLQFLFHYAYGDVRRQLETHLYHHHRKYYLAATRHTARHLNVFNTLPCAAMSLFRRHHQAGYTFTFYHRHHHIMDHGR